MHRTRASPSLSPADQCIGCHRSLTSGTIVTLAQRDRALDQRPNFGHELLDRPLSRHPRRDRSLVLSGLGILLTLGIVAPLASKELATFFFPPWWRMFAIAVTFGLLASGFIAAILSLVAARRMIHGALAISIASGVIWTVTIAVVTYFSFGYQLSAGDT